MEKNINYNMSLDEIIKMKKPKSSKNSRLVMVITFCWFLRSHKNYVFCHIYRKPKLTSKKTKNNNFPRNIKKSNTTQFKAKSRKKKLPSMQDARLKIMQNMRNKKSSIVKGKSPLLKMNVVDARMKIEARKQRVFDFKLLDCFFRSKFTLDNSSSLV